MSGRGKATKYFHIDPDLGVLYVRGDLQKEPDNEYQVNYIPQSYDSFFLLLSLKLIIKQTQKTLARYAESLGKQNTVSSRNH